MNAPLSLYLTRFSSRDLAEAASIELVSIDPEVTLRTADLEARIEAARRETRADAEREQSDAIAAIGVEHEAALAAARAEWCLTEGSGVASLVERAFANLHDKLSERIARILRPILAEATAERTVAVLVEALDQLLADPKHPVVTLHGPADLIEAVRAARPSLGGLALVVDDRVEAVCMVDGTHLETRLGASLAAFAATEA